MTLLPQFPTENANLNIPGRDQCGHQYHVHRRLIQAQEQIIHAAEPSQQLLTQPGVFKENELLADLVTNTE